MWAAPDLDAFNNSWVEPGIIVEVSYSLGPADHGAALSGWYEPPCESDGAQGFQTTDEYYSGQWHHGERHGHGELESADDGRYVGDFEQGLAAGKGTWTHQGSMYQGTWRAGERHGEGQFNSADGTIYQGQWQQGQRVGFGRQQFAGRAIIRHRIGRRPNSGETIRALVIGMNPRPQIIAVLRRVLVRIQAVLCRLPDFHCRGHR